MIVSEKTYGSESCHAYTKLGEPRHCVPYKDKKRKGELRPTTLRDIKENGWLPSVSSILGVMAKKGLDGWMKEQVANTAWDFTGRGDWPMGDWAKLVLEEAEARMTKARDLGTEIHGAIERFLERIAPAFNKPEQTYIPIHIPDSHSEHVGAAVAALKELGVWGQPFSSERTFASNLGFGGTIDFSTSNLIADFKCVDRLDKKLTYDDRCAQLCAYFMGFGNFYKWPNCRLVNIFISTSEPGKYLIHEWSTEDKERGWTMFQQCFALWKTLHRYDPSK